jgi:aminomethyltransferase
MGQRTVLHDWHLAHGGRMVDFGGWDMPVQYSTIIDEHNAVRSAAGLFDVSHMGRFPSAGPTRSTSSRRFTPTTRQR